MNGTTAVSQTTAAYTGIMQQKCTTKVEIGFHDFSEAFGPAPLKYNVPYELDLIGVKWDIQCETDGMGMKLYCRLDPRFDETTTLELKYSGIFYHSYKDGEKFTTKMEGHWTQDSYDRPLFFKNIWARRRMDLNTYRFEISAEVRTSNLCSLLTKKFPNFLTPITQHDRVVNLKGTRFYVQSQELKLWSPKLKTLFDTTTTKEVLLEFDIQPKTFEFFLLHISPFGMDRLPTCGFLLENLRRLAVDLSCDHLLTTVQSYNTADDPRLSIQEEEEAMRIERY